MCTDDEEDSEKEDQIPEEVNKVAPKSPLLEEVLMHGGPGNISNISIPNTNFGNYDPNGSSSFYPQVAPYDPRNNPSIGAYWPSGLADAIGNPFPYNHEEDFCQ